MKPEDLIIGRRYRYTNETLRQTFGGIFYPFMIREAVASCSWSYSGYDSKNDCYKFVPCKRLIGFFIPWKADELYKLEEVPE